MYTQYIDLKESNRVDVYALIPSDTQCEIVYAEKGWV